MRGGPVRYRTSTHEPGFRSALRLLAKIHADTGKTEKSLDCLRRLADLYPDDADIHYELGEQLLATRRCGKAVVAFRKALEIDDQDAISHVAHAMALHFVYDNQSAIEACEQAIRLNPNLAFAEGLLALCHAHPGHYDEANEHLDRAVRLSPRDPTLYWVSLAGPVSSLIEERFDEYFDRAKVFTKATPKLAVGWRHVRERSTSSICPQSLRLSGPTTSIALIRVIGR